MLSQVASFINEKSLISETDRVLCMVSGGADSVAMLHILHQLSSGAEPGFHIGFPLGICHVNYGRRGGDSDADEDFVRRIGYQFGITVHSVRAPTGDRPNFQSWARDFRYLAAQNLCRWQGYSRIAVAHNKDDRIETFIYRLITYSGRRSLAVMLPRRGRVVRPLLPFTAAEVRGYCAEQGIAYREDGSNKTLDYARNRIRHTVMPRLEEIRPDFREHVLDTLSLLEDEDSVLESVTGEAWRTVAVTEDGKTCLIAGELAGMPRATARLLVRRWLAGWSGPLRISHRVLDSVIDLCHSGDGSRELSLSGGLKVRRKYDRLEQAPVQAPAKKQQGGWETVSLPIPGRAAFGEYEIEAVENPPWDMAGDDLRVVLDGDALGGALAVRRWQDGDRFTPLGMSGRKSLQDLFTDCKVPRGERRRVPLVICGNDIVWVCGVRMSEDFKVTPRSERRVGLQAIRRTG